VSRTAEHRAFWSYFNVADETYDQGGPLRLTLADLDPALVAEARAATALGLPWPPYLPAAEDYALSNPEFVRGVPGW